MGGKDKPSIPYNIAGDYAGGTMFLAFGICAALLSASKTGKGQVVDAAMIDGVSVLSSILYTLSQSGIWNVKNRGSNLFDGGAPFYQVYKTKDDNFVSIGSLEPQFYQILKDKLELGTEFDNQMDPSSWPSLVNKLENIFKSKTRSEWNEIFEGTDVCYSPVLSIEEAKDHPHMKKRNNFFEINGITQPAPAPRFSESKISDPKIAPSVGQNNNEILKSLGYSDEDINKFIEEKIVE